MSIFDEVCTRAPGHEPPCNGLPRAERWGACWETQTEDDWLRRQLIQAGRPIQRQDIFNIVQRTLDNDESSGHVTDEIMTYLRGSGAVKRNPHHRYFSHWDSLGNPIVSDWCPYRPCGIPPSSLHRHSLILPEQQLDYAAWVEAATMESRG